MISTADERPPGLTRLLLGRMAARIVAQPWSTMAIVALVSLVCVTVAIRFLEFDGGSPVPVVPQAEVQQRWQEYVEQFGEPSDVVIVVEADDPRRVQAVIDELDGALRASPSLLSNVVARIDLRPLREKSLQFLTPDQLESVQDELAMYAPVLDGHWDRAGLEAYCQRLGTMLETPQPATGDTKDSPLESQLERARLLAASLSGYLVSSGAKFTSPWPALLPGSGPGTSDRFDVRYGSTHEGETGFITATLANWADDAAGTARVLTGLRELLEATRAAFPGVTIGLTGVPVLNSDEMTRSRRDTLLAALICGAGVTMLLLLGFRGVRYPLLVLMSLVVGGCWTVGYTTLAVGQLHSLSAAFVVLVMGLAIGFAVIPLLYYAEQRRSGRPLQESLIRSIQGSGGCFLTGAILVALSCSYALLTGLQSGVELGLIAGGSVLLCAAAALIVLPAIVAIVDPGIEAERISRPLPTEWLNSLTQRWPGIIAGTSTLLVVIVSLQGLTWQGGRVSPRTRFDISLLRLQTQGLESGELQQRLFLEPEVSPHYAVSLADSPEQARRLREQYLNLPMVLRVDELASWLPRYPATETGLLIQAIETRLDGLSSLPREFPQMDPLAIGQALEELYLLVRERPEPAARESAVALNRFLDGLNELEISRQLEFLSGYQYDMLAALHGQFQMLATMSNPQPIAAEDFPHELRSRFVSEAGHWLVQIYPREDLREQETLGQFVAAVRSVDPQATGLPMLAHDAAVYVEQSCLNAAWCLLAGVWLVLLMDSLKFLPAVISLLTPLLVVGFTIYTVNGDSNRLDPRLLVAIYVVVASLAAAVFDGVGVRNTLLTLAPPVGGLLLTAGLLPLLQIDLNPVNVLGLPLILGIGAFWGLQVVHDYRAHSGAYRMTSATFSGVWLSSASALIGFASLLVVEHEGVRSLGRVLLVGAASSLMLTLVTLPALLKLLQTARTESPFEQRTADQQQRHGRRGPMVVRSGEIPVSKN